MTQPGDMKGNLRWMENIETCLPMLSTPLGIVRDSILFCIDDEKLDCHRNDTRRGPSRTYTDATT